MAGQCGVLPRVITLYIYGSNNPFRRAPFVYAPCDLSR